MSTFILSRKTKKRLDREIETRCVERACRPSAPHGKCVDCGRLTDGRTARIEEGTLRRRVPFVCLDCQLHPRSTVAARQEALRKMRTTDDWAKVSDPLAHAAIIPDRMPEQYASAARDAVRAFVASSFETASVPASDPSTLNASIRTLGLQDVVYAEVRHEETVLRRIA